jgi:hypothetical protein
VLATADVGTTDVFKATVLPPLTASVVPYALPTAT